MVFFAVIVQGKKMFPKLSFFMLYGHMWSTFPKICTVQNTNSQVKMSYLTEFKKILRFHLVVIADIFAYICHQL